MAKTTWSNFTIAQIVISAICGIVGCSVLWSLTWDSVDGSLGDMEDQHHAFNFNVATVLIVLIVNIIAAGSESQYTRACHYFALGMTAYLFTGMGTSAEAIFGLNFDSTDDLRPDPDDPGGFLPHLTYCQMARVSSNGNEACIALNPVAFPEMNRIRMIISSDQSETDAQKKAFSGALFCQLSLFVGALIPLSWSFHKDRACIKIIFFCATIACGWVGVISLFTSSISGNSKTPYNIYSAVAQCVAITYFIMASTTAALCTTNHAVAKFTAAMAGVQGWLVLPALLVAASWGRFQMGMDDKEQRVIRVGAFFCFFSSISSLITVASILGGDDSGNNAEKAAKALVSNESRSV